MVLPTWCLSHDMCPTYLSRHTNHTPTACLPAFEQDVLVMSAAYGSYMATSSNLRYQLLAGLVEERGIEAVFKSNPAACAVLSFIVRTGNTFLGS